MCALSTTYLYIHHGPWHHYYYYCATYTMYILIYKIEYIMLYRVRLVVIICNMHVRIRCICAYIYAISPRGPIGFFRSFVAPNRGRNATVSSSVAHARPNLILCHHVGEGGGVIHRRRFRVPRGLEPALSRNAVIGCLTMRMVSNNSIIITVYTVSSPQLVPYIRLTVLLRKFIIHI